MPKQVHEVPSAPRPVGPYSVATEANGFVFLSGQVAIDPESNEPVRGDVYGVYLSESGPARSTAEVAALPAGFLVEIEIIAAR